MSAWTKIISANYDVSNNVFAVTDAGNFIIPPTDPVLQSWLAANNTIQPYVAPVVVPSCFVWQLKSVMTANQWSSAQTAVYNSGNSAVIAFFNQGTNLIPANSATLISLGTAIGLSANQVHDLVVAGASVSIS